MHRSPIWIPPLAILVLVTSIHGQAVECRLSHSSGVITGECLGAAVELRPGAIGQSRWLGTLAIGDTVIDVDVASYEYSSGPIEVFRTPWGWFIPTKLDLEGEPPVLAWSMSEEAPPSKTDLEILDRAQALIPTEERWDRADDRVCAQSDTTYSLYCAMAEATRLVGGHYQHRQPALQVVRRVVAEEWSELVVDHRLMDFNNHSKTTYAELMGIFDLSRERVLQSVR